MPKKKKKAKKIIKPKKAKKLKFNLKKKSKAQVQEKW